MASPITRNNFSAVDNLQLTDTLGLQFSGRSAAPTDADLAAGRLYYKTSTGLQVYDGSSWTTLGAAGASGGTLDSAYEGGASITIDTSTITLTQTLDSTGINLNKTGTGAGTPLLVQNAGTGDDVQIITTRAGATGIILDTHHDSATPADNDVLLEIQVNGEDDGSTKTEYGRIRFRSTDVTDTTEDADFGLALFVGGTQRTCLTVSGTTTTIGDGNTSGGAILTSSGNFDLTLQTGNATTGTVVLTDGANGDFTFAPNGSGRVIISSGVAITAGGSEASSWAVVGTTGQGLDITSSTITSGDVVRINHSASATLDGGNLLNLAIDGTAYYSFGEVTMTIAGTEGSNALAVTKGDVVLSDGSFALTDDDNAASFTVTNDTATSASVVVVAGSGVFTGNTTSAFATLTASGLTTGTVLYAPAAALTTGKVVDIAAAAATDGILINVAGGGANMTATGRMLKLAAGAATVGQVLEISTTGAYTGAGVVTVTADTATTAGATVGQGLVTVSADALTTGTCLDVTSTSIVLTTGRIADFSHISGSITGTLNKSGDFFNVSSNRVVTTGTVADDYDMLNLIRTSEINGGGTFSATGSVLYVENAVTNTSGTVTDTVNGVEVVMDSLGTGDGVKVTHSATAGKAINVVSSGTTAAGVVLATANSLTSGQLVKLASSATAITGAGRMLLVNHSGATSTSGILSEFASAAADGTTVLRVTASAALTGVALDITAASATTGTALDIGDLDALTTGKGINLVSNSSDTGAFILQQITNDHASATGALLLGLKQDSTGDSMFIDHNGITGKALFIDHEGTTQTGGVVDISAAVLTTGTVIDIGDADGLTTGKILNLVSNSADTGTRTLVQLTQDHASASGTTLLNMKQDNAISTNYARLFSMTNHAGTTVTIWVGAGTTPNGNLSGSQGDLCLNGDGSGNLFRCSGTTTWVSTI